MDRFELGRKDCQDEAAIFDCEWCNCEIYSKDELFLADYTSWVCEDCYDQWQKKNKRRAAFSWRG